MKGLPLGIDLVRDPQNKTRVAADAEQIMHDRLKKDVALKGIEENILTHRPMLTITKNECDVTATALENARERNKR